MSNLGPIIGGTDFNLPGVGRLGPLAGGGAALLPPMILTAPVIDNLSPTVGDTLTFTQGTYTGSPTSYTQQWFANGLEVVGETTSTFTLTNTYTAAVITVKEVAINAAGSSAENESGPTAAVTQIPTWDSPATIDSNGDLNNPIVGDTLAADASGCVGWPGPTLAYEWQRNLGGGGTWDAIGGATTQPYQIAALDSGYSIRCVITGTNAIGSVPSTSNESGIVL